MSHIQTRARAAALKRPLAENVTKVKQPTIETRKRAALGDLSNVQNAQPAKAIKGKPTRVLSASKKKKAEAAPVEKDANESLKENIAPKEEKPIKKKAASFEVPVPKQLLNEEPLDELEQRVRKLAEVEPYWDDLDADDAGDPLMASPYVIEIFEYLHILEAQTQPNPDYINDQKELSWKMRAILVDWLIDVHSKFRLLPETLYLAVNIVDRFLSNRVVSLVKLQLVGLTSLFIASKYEEVIHPSIKNFVYVADNSYTEEEVLKAERYILQVLNFDLQYPNPMNFLRRISKADDYDPYTRTLGKYLMEVVLLEHEALKYSPSIVAAASMFLARKMVGKTPAWNNNLQYYAGEYTEEQVTEVAQFMINVLAKPKKFETVYTKYAHKKFVKVAVFAQEWVEKNGSL